MITVNPSDFTMRLRIQYFALVVLMPTAFHVCAAVLYVDLNNPSPIPLYTNWLTAATNIQDAIDATAVPQELERKGWKFSANLPHGR
jgi:hypothetical protein